jgi:ubiquinone biosynthesis protein
MLFFRPHRRLRTLRRVRQILTRLAYYGFAELAEAIGLRRRRIFPGAVQDLRPGRRVRRLPFGARLRMLFEELGPTFIKLGQVLSLRSDILPEEITEELRRLQYGAAPLAFDRLEPVLDEALGRPWQECFSSIEPEPVASASIAQVHRGVTRKGRTVALKIQRPGIDELIQSDLSILADLAALIERYLPRARIYRPVELVDHFAKVISLELDFAYEGRTMDLVRQNFRGEPAIHVPEVLWGLSSERLLTMEFIEGVRLSDEELFDKAGIDTSHIAIVGTRYVLTQVFEHGIFNADPHPANFIVRPDGVLVPLDFGMIGLLDQELKQALVAMLVAFINQDPDKLLRVFYNLELLSETTQRSRSELSQDLSRLIHYYHHMPLAQLSIGRMLLDLSAIIRRHRISLPVDLALTLKVIVTVESLGKSLDPEFDVISVAKPFVERVRLGGLRDWLDKDKLIDLAEDTGRLARALPYDTYEILKKLRSGRLKLNFDIEDFDQRIRDVDRSINRLSFAVVIAGLLIGSSFFLQGAAQPILFGMPILGVAGFGIAVILGVWFLIGIIRSGRL